MKDILNRYFSNPILFEVLGGIFLSALIWYFIYIEKLQVPEIDRISSVSSDVFNIAMTLSGLILTILTVLVTFKSSTQSKGKKSKKEEKKPFELFFESILYFQTVSILKNSVFSLLMISTCGYSLKLTLTDDYFWIIFLYIFFCLGIIILTILKTLFQLSEIIRLQNV